MPPAALLAVAAALLFAGAALVISVAEQPARLTLPAEAMLVEWRRSYAHAAPMQAGLAVIGTLAAAAAWWTGGGRGWLIGAAALIANLPWTLVVMRPVNGALNGAPAIDAVPALVVRWGRLHAVRTLLGLAASVIFLAQLR